MATTPVLATAAESLPTVLLLRWQQHGGHFHCRLFTARARNMAFAKCGDLIFDEREWPAVKEAFVKIALVRAEEEAL